MLKIWLLHQQEQPVKMKIEKIKSIMIQLQTKLMIMFLPLFHARFWVQNMYQTRWDSEGEKNEHVLFITHCQGAIKERKYQQWNNLLKNDFTW